MSASAPVPSLGPESVRAGCDIAGEREVMMIAQFALGWCPAPRRVPQPSKRAETFARMLAETRIGWPLEWRAWSPRFADGALLSGYDNVPNVELDGIAPSELLTGQIRIAIANIRDDQLVRLSTAPSHAVPEATLLLCEYAPGWAWTPENTPCVWQFRSSLYHGLVYHIEGAVELYHQLDCLLSTEIGVRVYYSQVVEALS